MPAVVDGQAAGAGVDLGEHRGDELFVRPAAVSLTRIQPAGEAGVEPPGHLGQRVDLVGDLAEDAKHVGRDLHRVQPLPRASPTISRIPNWVRATSYRSPP